MFTIEKTFEIAASHSLSLNYESKCQGLHGHNWIITVTCQSETLNENGMVIDFGEIKRLIHEKLDHKNLNEILSFNTTAENLAKWVCEQIPFCRKVSIQESTNNVATYEI